MRRNTSWTAESEALSVSDIQQGLAQLYWAWAAERQGQSDEAIAVENPIQESQAAPFPVIGELHQSYSRTEGRPDTSEDNSNLSVPILGEGPQEPSQFRIMRASDLAEREVTAHDGVEPVAAAMNTNSGREQQRPDDGEEPGEGGEPSSISLTRIRHDQPRARLTGLDYADNELFDLLGDDTQDDLTQADFEFIHPAGGLEDSGLWSMASVFEMDDAPYLLEDFEAPHEGESPNGLGRPYPSIKHIGADEETVITTEFRESAVVPQPLK